MAVNIYPVRQVQVRSFNLDLGKVKEDIGKRIDTFVEYPGSIKGENGWWRFPEWVEYRVDQTLKKRGERV